MSAFDAILEDLAALRQRVEEQRTTLALGTYQSDGTVLLADGAEVEPAATLVLVGTGDKVLLAQHNRRAYIVGQASPTATSYSLGSLSDVDTTGATTGDHLVFDGTGWAPSDPGGGVALRACAGQASITFAANVAASASVSFGVTFASAPRVLLTLEGALPTLLVFSADSVTTTGFTLRGRSSSTSSETFTVNWLAIPDGSLTV